MHGIHLKSVVRRRRRKERQWRKEGHQTWVAETRGEKSDELTTVVVGESLLLYLPPRETRCSSRGGRGRRSNIIEATAVV